MTRMGWGSWLARGIARELRFPTADDQRREFRKRQWRKRVDAAMKAKGEQPPGFRGFWDSLNKRGRLVVAVIIAALVITLLIIGLTKPHNAVEESEAENRHAQQTLKVEQERHRTEYLNELRSKGECTPSLGCYR